MKRKSRLLRRQKRIIRYELSQVHVLSNPWISIPAGLIILFFAGLLIRG